MASFPTLLQGKSPTSLVMMPFTKSVTRCQYERLIRWSSASSSATSVILKARTLT